MMIKMLNTMKRQVPSLLFTALFLALFKACFSSQDGGVNSQQNVKSEPSLLPTILEPEKDTILSSATGPSKRECNQSPPLLIISFDGFRYDYFDAFQLDNLRSFSRSGVRAKNGMKGVFTTKTFPSHWSIATGMYQQSHGVVGNRFYDPISEKVFGKKSEQINREWFKGEPIWVTAKKCGKKVGIYFWVGSEIDFGSNLNPDEFKKYNESVPLEDRMTQVIHWLTVSKYDLVMMYWNEPDTSGHAFGTFSNQVHQSLNRIDGQLSRLINALKKDDLLDKTNVIILSDHGMTNLTTSVTFSSNVTDNVIYSNEGVVTHFWPKESSEAFVEESLKKDLDRGSQAINEVNGDNQSSNTTSAINLSHEDLSDDRLLTARRLDGDNVSGSSNGSKPSSRSAPFYTIYKKEQLPEKWKYKNNERVAPIVVVAQEGVYLQQVIFLLTFIPSSSRHRHHHLLHCPFPSFASLPTSETFLILFPQTMYAVVCLLYKSLSNPLDVHNVTRLFLPLLTSILPRNKLLNPTF